MTKKRKAALIGGAVAALICLIGLIFVLVSEGVFMQSKDIRVERFEKYTPTADYDFDFEAAYEKGYSTSKDEITLEYFELQDKYLQALNLLLSDRLSLETFDAEMQALGAKEPPEETPFEIEKAQLYYWDFFSLNSSYLCLRSNIKVERLAQEDVELLRAGIIEDESDREALKEMAERTYEDVLKVKFSWSEHEDFSAGFTNGGTERANNNAIVLWLVYSQEFPNGNYPDSEAAKRRAVEELAEKYSEIFTGEMGHEVVVFVHSIIVE